MYNYVCVLHFFYSFTDCRRRHIINIIHILVAKWEMENNDFKHILCLQSHKKLITYILQKGYKTSKES